jgi:hypothetical protein
MLLPTVHHLSAVDVALPFFVICAYTGKEVVG